MGSVKDLKTDDSLAGRLFIPSTAMEFGQGGMQTSGRYSVADLKKMIPDSDIKDKAYVLAMTQGAFFEWLSTNYPDIPHCYVGLMDKDGKIVDSATLLDRGELSNVVVMKIAHTPDSFSGGDLAKYRAAMASGELQCAVADVESIFRKGLPLGSSAFKKIFGAVGISEQYYETIATYDDTVKHLDMIREFAGNIGIKNLGKLEALLRSFSLGTTIPNPGFVLKDFTFDSTTKFEEAGDRDITAAEAQELSGLSPEGYDKWTKVMYPALADAQIRYCDERNMVNIDGKSEVVAYRRMPVLTDFVCSPDENRIMIVHTVDGTEWALPTNKEVGRAIFRLSGVYAAKAEATERAKKAGSADNWKEYMPAVLQERGIDLNAVSEHACTMMSYAMAEVGNRLLGRKVFDAAPIDTWARHFVPFASKLTYQQ